MLVTYDDYVSLWPSDVIDGAKWEHYEQLARLEVAAATFDRIYSLEPLTECVKVCICEAADRIYRREQMTKLYGAAVSSVSNDGVSINYAGAADTLTEAGFRLELAGVIKKHLGNTGLLFRGVR